MTPDTEPLLILKDAEGRTLLTFDINEEGVHLTYDPADLPAITKMSREIKGLITK